MKKISELSNLEGHVALITGGAGNIGSNMAMALDEMGATVVIVDKHEDRCMAVLEKIQKVSDKKHTYFLADLEKEKEVLSIVDSVSKKFGQLDVLINNAAFVGESDLEGFTTPFKDQSIKTWRRALEVNLSVPFLLSQKFAPLLSKNKRGSIINIGSTYGIVGPDMSIYEGTDMGNPAAYAASKGGLIQLTRWLSTILAPDIRVNAISPGGVSRGQPASFQEKYVKKTPLGRMAEESDYIGATVFLASQLSKYVTGSNLVVDGGWTAW